MASYPKNLQYYLKSLTGYSRKKYQLTPNISKTQVVNNGAKIIVKLPSNSIVDWDTFTMFFKGTANPGHKFSKNIESIIANVQVEANGGFLDDGVQKYNLLQRRLFDATLGDKLLQRSKLHGSIVAGVVPGASNTVFTPAQYAVNNWMGYVGTSQPRCQDLSILGDVSVHITLAGPEVLIANSSAVSPGFSLTDIYFTVETIQIQDGNYYDAISERLSSENNPIEIPFQAWRMFSPGQTSLTQTTQGTLSTSSLDVLVGTYQVTGLNSMAVNSNLASSTWFQTGSANITNSRFQINSKYYPDYQQTPAETYIDTLNAFGLSQDALGAPDTCGGTSGLDNNIITLADWQASQFTSVLRLNHPTSGEDRVKSGLNLLGTNATIAFETNGTEASITPVLFAGMTKVVEVGKFKQLNVVQ